MTETIGLFFLHGMSFTMVRGHGVLGCGDATKIGKESTTFPTIISDLLEEKEHTPGIVKDYFYLEEYKFVEERVLEIVRELKPELKDQL